MKCFVSREEKDWAQVIEACAPLALEWHCQSLIRIKPVAFELPERSFEWVFFSSKEAVYSFFRQQTPSLHFHYGAIGNATAQVLAQFAKPSFVGETKDTQTVAQAFSKTIGTSAVLFPISDISVRTIQQQLAPEQVIDLVVYSTQFKPVQIPTCALYIFTSPSNVASFFQLNTLPLGAQIAVFGSKTGDQIQRYTDLIPVILDQPDALSLASAIKQNFLR